MQILNTINSFKTSAHDQIIHEGGQTYYRFYDETLERLTIDYLSKEQLSANLLSIHWRFEQQTAYEDRLERISERICTNITYLSESFRLIELDRLNHKIQIRSAPPYKKNNLSSYFEIILDFEQHFLKMNRNVYDKNTRNTYAIPFVISYETLERLVTDFDSL